MNTENEKYPQNECQHFTMPNLEKTHVVMRIWYEGDLERHEYLHGFDGDRPRGSHYQGKYGHGYASEDAAYADARKANEHNEDLCWIAVPWVDVPGMVQS